MSAQHVRFVPVEGWINGSRTGYYENHISDDQWWTLKELAQMLLEMEEASNEARHFLAWQTIRSEWDDDTEHWYLRIDVYGETR